MMNRITSNMRAAATALRSAATSHAGRVAAIDVGGIAAAASIAYGFWMIYPAAGFIAAGTLVLTGVMVAARKGG